jgi:hypothetical protein
MAYDTRNYWVLELLPSSGILKKLKNTMFRKLGVFPPSVLRSEISGKSENKNQYKIKYMSTNTFG